MAFAVGILSSIVSDGCAGQAVAGQHNRALDLKYVGVQGSDPVFAIRGVPVDLLNSMVFGVIGFPEALPVFGPRVVKAGDQEDRGEGFHNRLIRSFNLILKIALVE